MEERKEKVEFNILREGSKGGRERRKTQHQGKQGFMKGEKEELDYVYWEKPVKEGNSEAGREK